MWVIVSIVGLFLASPAPPLGPSPATAAARPAVNSAYVSVDWGQVPVWVAREARLFEQHGLAVTLVYVRGSDAMAKAMLAGEIPIGIITGSTVIQGRLSGMDVVLVGSVLDTMDYHIAVRPGGIERPEELRGKTLAIARFGSASDFAARVIIRALGLTPIKDVPLLQVGNTQERLSALVGGAVDAAMIIPPATYIAKQRGLRILADMKSLGLLYQYEGIGTTRSFVRSSREVIERYMKGIVAAIHLFKTNRARGVEIVAKYMRMRDTAAIEAQYDEYTKLINAKPYPNVKGMQNIIDYLISEGVEKARGMKAADAVDLSFVRALDETKFIDGLYR